MMKKVEHQRSPAIAVQHRQRFFSGAMVIQLSEEGAVQVFRPLFGNNYILRLDKGRMLCNSAGESNPGREEMKRTK